MALVKTPISSQPIGYASKDACARKLRSGLVSARFELPGGRIDWPALLGAYAWAPTRAHHRSIKETSGQSRVRLLCKRARVALASAMTHRIMASPSQVRATGDIVSVGVMMHSGGAGTRSWISWIGFGALASNNTGCMPPTRSRNLTLRCRRFGANSVAIFSVSTSFNSADDDYSVTARMRLNCGLFVWGEASLAARLAHVCGR
jgi:hypothetical protein